MSFSNYHNLEGLDIGGNMSEEEVWEDYKESFGNDNMVLYTENVVEPTHLRIYE